VGLTVREAMALEGVGNLILVAGEAGLDRLIQHVTVIEVPDAEKWLKGNEFLITAFFNLRGALYDQMNLMEAASRKGCSALAILAHPEGYKDDLPLALKMKADQISLPLFKMPDDVAYIDVIYPIYREIVNRQTRQLEYAMDAHTKMTDVFFEGKRMPELVSLIVDLVGNPVMILDKWGNVLEAAWPKETTPLSDFSERFRSRASVIVDLGDNLNGEDVLPAGQYPAKPDVFVRRYIRIGRSKYGAVVVWVNLSPLTRLHMMALEQACTVLAYYMEKERVVQEVRNHLNRDLLDEIIAGANYDDISSRCQSLGWRVQDKGVVLIARWESGDFEGSRRLQSSDQDSDDNYYVLRSILEKDSPNHTPIRRGNSVVVLMDIGRDVTPARVKKAAVRLAGGMADALKARKSSVAVGIGNAFGDPQEMRRSYSEARDALAMGKRISPGESVFHIADLAGYHHLYSLSTPESRREFSTRILGPLLDYDESCQGGLVATLDAILSCGGSVSEAARRLYIHRNTLRYRLEKIREILGYDPLAEPHCLNIQMALAMRHLSA